MASDAPRHPPAVDPAGDSALGQHLGESFKDTAIVSVIAVPELMYRGKVLSIETYRPVEIYTAVALIYFFVTYPKRARSTGSSSGRGCAHERRTPAGVTTC